MAAALTETIRQLTGEFVLLDLGSANSVALFRRYPALAQAATLIAVDARGDTPGNLGNFHRTIRLQQAVAGVAGTRPFFSREFPECSSFLEPKTALERPTGWNATSA